MALAVKIACTHFHFNRDLFLQYHRRLIGRVIYPLVTDTVPRPILLRKNPGSHFPPISAKPCLDQFGICIAAIGNSPSLPPDTFPMSNHSLMASVFDANFIAASGDVTLYSTDLQLPDDKLPLRTQYLPSSSQRGDANAVLHLGPPDQGRSEPIPVGMRDWAGGSAQPVVMIGLRGLDAVLAISALPSDAGTILTSGQLRLAEGAVQLALAPGVPLAPGQPFVAEIRFDPLGAFSYERAIFNAGNGWQKLQPGVQFVQVVDVNALRIDLACGDSARLDLFWTFASF